MQHSLLSCSVTAVKPSHGPVSQHLARHQIQTLPLPRMMLIFVDDLAPEGTLCRGRQLLYTVVPSQPLTVATPEQE